MSRLGGVVGVLAELAAHPAAPFREHGVAGVVRARLAALGLPAHCDRYGNISARYRSGSPAAAFALVAHMDHPGFEVRAAAGGRPRALVLGGVDPAALRRGGRVRAFTAHGEVRGRIAAVRATRTGLRFSIDAPGPVPAGAWGVWDLPDFEERDGLCHLRAADDLSGCAIILATLAHLVTTGDTADVTAVFTRAEEVGLVGAALAARAGTVPRGTLVVSLEASRRLPGAEQGSGPVIRVGDARSTFSHTAERWLHAGRDLLAGRRPPVGVQRQLMSGGTCEATAFAARGYHTTGIALPLGNYHNRGDDSALAAETIHPADLNGAVDLVIATLEQARRPWTAPQAALMERRVRTFRRRLAAAPLAGEATLG